MLKNARPFSVVPNPKHVFSSNAVSNAVFVDATNPIRVSVSISIISTWFPINNTNDKSQAQRYFLRHEIYLQLGHSVLIEPSEDVSSIPQNTTLQYYHFPPWTNFSYVPPFGSAGQILSSPLAPLPAIPPWTTQQISPSTQSPLTVAPAIISETRTSNSPPLKVARIDPVSTYNLTKYSAGPERPFENVLHRNDDDDKDEASPRHSTTLRSLTDPTQPVFAAKATDISSCKGSVASRYNIDDNADDDASTFDRHARHDVIPPVRTKRSIQRRNHSPSSCEHYQERCVMLVASRVNSSNEDGSG